MSDAAWAGEFAKYQAIPQYRERNAGMSLDEFKTIYWGEWTHRLLGRVIGAAFLLPVVLVALNFTGLLPGRTILHAWRWVTVAVFVFAAMATPTPDVTSMLFLAVPMLALFGVAIGICLLRDRRRGRTAPQWGDLDDDAASPL